MKRLFCRHDYKFVRNIEWKRSLWMCPKCGSFQYRNEIKDSIDDKCDGCNNIRGCITCEDGSEWAHYEEHEEPVSEDLGEYINELSKQFPDVSFAKLSRIAVRVAKWQKERVIDKACVWLSNVCIEDMTYKYDDFDTSEGWYKFIEDFKNYMKGE